MPTDPYATLGVPHTATDAEITRAYRRQLRDHHPDTRPDAPDSGERLAQILAAYALLRDPRRRAEYDRKGRPAARSVRAVRGAAVTPVGPGVKRPPLWAGPVRWHPGR